MVYDLWIQFPIYMGWNKTRKKVSWLQIIAGIISHMTHFNVVGLYQCIDELVSVWFYFTFIFIIEFVFNDFQYENRVLMVCKRFLL